MRMTNELIDRQLTKNRQTSYLRGTKEGIGTIDEIGRGVRGVMGIHGEILGGVRGEILMG